MIFVKRLLLAFAIIYLLPTVVAAGWWAVKERPASWREARWSSSGLLPRPADDPRAALYVFSATTGGMKGAVASHAWIVMKGRNAARYDRYDKVGWGNPIRHNGYAPDAFWYSNPPQVVAAIKGEAAERLIPAVEAAIAAYPHAKPGGYRIYPGPNSNTFVAHVLRSVPEIGAVLPPDAVGRDYLPQGRFYQIDSDWQDAHATLYGLAGISVGVRSGVELHLFGLVAGLDFADPGIKIPALGTLHFF